MKIALIAGARPNFIKAAPLYRALIAHPEISVRLIHTGQHPDPGMSTGLGRELGLPDAWTIIPGTAPTAASEVARIMSGLEPVLREQQPDWVLVIGDVNSTLAGALAAKMGQFPLAHVEAGLRSGDRSMPEELNRIVVDHLADRLFAGEEAAVNNLRAEGIDEERIFFCGNALIDALYHILPQAKSRNPEEVLSANALVPVRQPNPAAGAFALCTFHRPSNVDSRPGLQRLLELLHLIAQRMAVVFPLHPRTAQQLKAQGLYESLVAIPGLTLLHPLRYTDVVCLLGRAAVVVTDSGGIQEEATALGTPCLTFRSTTERPATILYGSNTLIDRRDPAEAARLVDEILAGRYKRGSVPPLWDGHAAGRMVDILLTRK